MSKKYVFVINPTAGKNNSAVSFVPKIKAFLKTYDLDGEIYFTKCQNDAKVFVENYCKTLDKETVFFACGGDGTLNEVVNGAVGCPLACVGILPLGSGNDYIKSLGKDLDFLDLTAQLGGEEKYVDLISVNGRYVANMCNIGFDATVAHNFVKFKSVPGVSGKMAYSISVFYCLINKIAQKMHIIIDDKTEVYDDLLLCSISKGIYCGGQYPASPDSDVFDGYIDVLPIKKISRARFIKFFSYYKNGTHVSSPEMNGIVSYYKCKKAVIKNAKNLPVCFDGDTTFINGDVTFEVVPKALKVLFPSKSEAISE